MTSAKDLGACPVSEMPEFAFIGRSNVGKSSLINMLAARGELAKTSSTPGKTQLINFFTINETWSLVDLPGYGFAKVAKRTQTDFNRSVGDYFLNRENLKHLFVLIDSRIETMEIDLDFLSWLKSDCSVSHSIVLTKIDKISGPALEQKIETFSENLKAWNLEVPAIISTSSEDKRGRGAVLAKIDSLLPKKQPKKKKKKAPVSLDWAKRGKR